MKHRVIFTKCLLLYKQESKIVKTIAINCMMFRNAQKIYQNIASGLGASTKLMKTYQSALSYIEEQVSKKGQML